MDGIHIRAACRALHLHSCTRKRVDASGYETISKRGAFVLSVPSAMLVHNVRNVNNGKKCEQW